MVDIDNEQLIPFSKATHLLPGNPSYPTLHRYVFKGRHGVKLESVIICGRRYTSRRLYIEFVERVNAIISGKSPLPTPQERTPRQRRVSHERATAKLSRMQV
jgi:Protein of unknown function (DUF1580)